MFYYLSIVHCNSTARQGQTITTLASLCLSVCHFYLSIVHCNSTARQRQTITTLASLCLSVCLSVCLSLLPVHCPLQQHSTPETDYNNTCISLSVCLSVLPVHCPLQQHSMGATDYNNTCICLSVCHFYGCNFYSILMKFCTVIWGLTKVITLFSGATSDDWFPYFTPIFHPTRNAFYGKVRRLQ